MQNNQYNGWTNYETWLLNLWYDDAFTDIAQELYNEHKELALDYLVEYIESYINDTIDDSTPSFQTDIVSNAIKLVNFEEIAQHYIDETDKEEAA